MLVIVEATFSFTSLSKQSRKCRYYMSDRDLVRAVEHKAFSQTKEANSLQFSGPKYYLQLETRDLRPGSCFYHVFQPDSWLLTWSCNISLLYQPHPSTCSLTTPTPHLLHRTERVLPNIPEHPRFKGRVLGMVLSFLNSMPLVYVMCADIPSDSLSMWPS